MAKDERQKIGQIAKMNKASECIAKSFSEIAPVITKRTLLTYDDDDGCHVILINEDIQLDTFTGRGTPWR
jgi:hypothetical protein